LLALAWSLTLPPGWVVVGVSGDGNPSLGLDGVITFLGSLSGNPLNFSYSVRVPAGQTQDGIIGGTVTYQYAGMPTPATTTAQTLNVTPRVYHSADCNQNWIIETLEANQVTAYWRAGAYHLYQFNCDGYAPGPGDQTGPRHSADYQGPFWQIDGTELNRVLAYWRAGCYHTDTNAPDGFSAGCGSAGTMGSIAQQAPSLYTPGSTVTVTNSLTYSGAVLSLLWRPTLPAGWTLLSVAGDGSPELVNGEITWTGSILPPSPVHFTYTAQVASGDAGQKQIRGAVDYTLAGFLNPTKTYASPDPLMLSTPVAPTMTIKLLSNGNIQLGLAGMTTAGVRVMTSPTTPATNWNMLASLPPLTNSAVYTDTTATNKGARFYRLVSP
jgi:hypothetical protein